MRQPYLVLALTLVAVVVSGCTNTPPTITPAPVAGDPESAATVDPNAESLTLEVLNSEVALGLERVSFTMTDADGLPFGSGADVDVSFYKVSEPAAGQEELQKAASGKALYFGEALPGGGAWVVYNDFDSSGRWVFDVTARSGSRLGQGRGSLEVAGTTDAPRIGAAAPTTDTPRLEEGTDLDALTSDASPVEALYTMSLADAFASGQPTVVLFASPAHCATDDCRATLEEVKKLLGQRGSSMNFLHIESRDLDEPDQLSETAAAWGLASDLWTFVFDERGFVAARAEGPIDSVELGLLIDEFVPARP